MADQNPFMRYVKDPKLYPNPDKMKVDELLKYESLEIKKLNYTLKNFRGSLIYMAGTFALFAVTSLVCDNFVKDNIHGFFGYGGNYLDLKSVKSTADYAYNREFQRMKYLSESPAGDESSTTLNTQILKDLGVEVPEYGFNSKLYKRAPHPKYY